jgi:hypothetical protein
MCSPSHKSPLRCGHELINFKSFTFPPRELETETETETNRQLARNAQANLFPSILSSEPSVTPDSRVYVRDAFLLFKLCLAVSL